jgi:hypothetical protein
MIENISFDHDYLLTGRRLGLVGECFDITAASVREKASAGKNMFLPTQKRKNAKKNRLSVHPA